MGLSSCNSMASPAGLCRSDGGKLLQPQVSGDSDNKKPYGKIFFLKKFRPGWVSSTTTGMGALASVYNKSILVKTSTMSPFLPPEILNLIFGHFSDERTTLGVCCQVSSSWTSSARRHLFSQIEFSPESPIESWIKAFPDHSISPAHHARLLSLSGADTLDAAGTHALEWVRAFCSVVDLRISAVRWTPGGISLVPFHGLFPTLTSFSVNHSYILPSELVGFIYSLPLLKDLDLRPVIVKDTAVTHEWNTPSTLPELTGTLHLVGKVQPIARELLGLPRCLRFSKIVLECYVEDAYSARELVLKCCDTLESFFVGYTSMGTFPSA